MGAAPAEPQRMGAGRPRHGRARRQGVEQQRERPGRRHGRRRRSWISGRQGRRGSAAVGAAQRRRKRRLGGDRESRGSHLSWASGSLGEDAALTGGSIAEGQRRSASQRQRGWHNTRHARAGHSSNKSHARSRPSASAREGASTLWHAWNCSIAVGRSIGAEAKQEAGQLREPRDLPPEQSQRCGRARRLSLPGKGRARVLGPQRLAPRQSEAGPGASPASVRRVRDGRIFQLVRVSRALAGPGRVLRPRV
mmetsp:Transcript_6576/g.27066  ORF Transcript_6576/g.27066 Transcript_6576/m.27066 type:complete len:251 (+) Transcript_6576:2088-2840(+)